MGTDLRQEMSTMGTDLREEMSAMGADLRQQIHVTAEQVRSELRQEIRDSADQVRSELRQEIRDTAAETQRQIELFEARLVESMAATAAETRRYFGVVAEDLKSDIKAVAEGLGALDEKVERFRGEVREDFGRVDRRLLHLEVRVIGRSDPA